MKWWTPDPHPCLGGCGKVLQHPWAKRCSKCDRAHAKVQYRERRERGVCVECGKVPAFQGGRLCKVHRELAREYSRKAKAKKRQRQRRDPKFVNCEICGIKIRKNGNVKYCRPCSAVKAVTYERIYAERKREKGLCASCKRVPAKEDRVFCEECSAKRLGDHRRIYHERKREGLCAQCGKVPARENRVYCEECRRDRKLKEIRQQLRKEG